MFCTEVTTTPIPIESSSRVLMAFGSSDNNYKSTVAQFLDRLIFPTSKLQRQIKSMTIPFASVKPLFKDDFYVVYISHKN